MHPTPTSMFTAAVLAASFVLATPTALAAPPKESPVTVNMQIRAPFLGSNWGPPTLWTVETDGRYPFSKDFAIPYSTLEKEIDDLIEAAIPNNKYGVEKCGGVCPEVEWRVRLDPKFRFTKKGQPKLTQIGNSGQGKVRVELETEARLDLHADITAETWIQAVEVPVDVFIVVGLKASVDIGLWPDLSAKQPGTSKNGVKVEFQLVDTDLQFDLNGTAIELGFKWGTVLGGIGLLPLGLIGGAPIIGAVFGILGDAAADAAEAEINAVFARQVKAMFDQQTEKLGTIVNDHIDPYITQANDLKDDVLDTPIPGVGKTIEQLRSDFGADLQLHTVATTSSVSSAAILRMSGASAGGKLFGKVRVPKEVCSSVSFSAGGVSGTLPLGLEPANQDLDAKVGQNCSAALSEKMGRKLFRGASPRAALGASAESLTVWGENAGSFAYTGKVRETNDYYECDFEVTGLPKASILEMSLGDLTARGVSMESRYARVLTHLAAGKSRVFDGNLAPLPEGTGGNSALIVGGAGKCGSGGSGGGLTANKLKALKDSLNPENCPMCGLTKVPGSWVYEPADMKAIAGNPIIKEVVQQVKQRKAKLKMRAAQPNGGATPAAAGATPGAGAAK